MKLLSRIIKKSAALLNAPNTTSVSTTSWLVPTVLLLLLFGLYLPSLRDALVFDDALITSGQLFAEYGSLLALKPRMLSYGSIVWLHAVVGDAWWVQRLANVVLHTAVWRCSTFFIVSYC